MKSSILVMCLLLYAIIGNAQYDNRVMPINPLRRGDGSFVQSGNALYSSNNRSNRVDTMISRPPVHIGGAVGGNPFSLRFNSVQAQCDPNSMQLNWTAFQQQNDADHFEIEQTEDQGLHWKTIGVVAANQFPTGENAYTYSYNKFVSDAQFRITAVNTGGERVHSSAFESPCSNTAMLMVTPNPVISTATVRIGSSASAKVKILVVNSSGNVMQVHEEGLTAGANPISFDMSSLPSGLYTISIIWQSGKQDAIRVMKQ